MGLRRLHRFFTNDPIQTQGDIVRLGLSDTTHLQNTLRLKPGDTCLLANGTGIEAEAVILELLPQGARLEVRKIFKASQAASGVGIRLFIYPAYLQKGKMDDIFRQMQELAVAGVFPILTERTVVKLSGAAESKVLDRWTKITREALKQSGALQALDLSGPRSLKEVVGQIPAQDRKIVFHPGTGGLSFSTWVKQADLSRTYHLFFGPEGGFTEKEVQYLESESAQKVRLGEVILKADTAILGVVSGLKFLSYE